MEYNGSFLLTSEISLSEMYQMDLSRLNGSSETSKEGTFFPFPKTCELILALVLESQMFFVTKSSRWSLVSLEMTFTSCWTAKKKMEWTKSVKLNQKNLDRICKYGKKFHPKVFLTLDWVFLVFLVSLRSALLCVSGNLLLTYVQSHFCRAPDSFRCAHPRRLGHKLMIESEHEILGLHKRKLILTRH